MKHNAKKLFGITTAALFGFNLFVFLFNYLFFLLYEYAPEVYSALSFVYEILFPPLTDLALLVTPVLTGFTMLFFGLGKKDSILSIFLAILPSLSRTLYFVPYYYLQLVLYEYYDSVDALVESLLPSFLWSLLSYGLAIASYLILRLTLAIGEKKGRDCSFEFKGFFAFDNYLSRGVGILALLGFLYGLTSQIIATVSYLIDYAGDYRIDEIIYMAIFYLLVLVLPFILYLCPELLRKKITVNRISGKK